MNKFAKKLRVASLAAEKPAQTSQLRPLKEKLEFHGCAGELRIP